MGQGLKQGAPGSNRAALGSQPRSATGGGKGAAEPPSASRQSPPAGTAGAAGASARPTRGRGSSQTGASPDAPPAGSGAGTRPRHSREAAGAGAGAGTGTRAAEVGAPKAGGAAGMPPGSEAAGAGGCAMQLRELLRFSRAVATGPAVASDGGGGAVLSQQTPAGAVDGTAEAPAAAKRRAAAAAAPAAVAAAAAGLAAAEFDQRLKLAGAHASSAAATHGEPGLTAVEWAELLRAAAAAGWQPSAEAAATLVQLLQSDMALLGSRPSAGTSAALALAWGSLMVAQGPSAPLLASAASGAAGGGGGGGRGLLEALLLQGVRARTAAAEAAEGVGPEAEAAVEAATEAEAGEEAAAALVDWVCHGALTERPGLLRPSGWVDLAEALAALQLTPQRRSRLRQHPHPQQQPPPPLQRSPWGLRGPPGDAWAAAFLQGTCHTDPQRPLPPQRAAELLGLDRLSLRRMATALWALEVLFPRGLWRRSRGPSAVQAAPRTPGPGPAVGPALPRTGPRRQTGATEEEGRGRGEGKGRGRDGTRRSYPHPSTPALSPGQRWLREWWDATSRAVLRPAAESSDADVLWLLQVAAPLLADPSDPTPPQAHAASTALSRGGGGSGGGSAGAARLHPPAGWRSRMAQAVEFRLPHADGADGLARAPAQTGAEAADGVTVAEAATWVGLLRLYVGLRLRRGGRAHRRLAPGALLRSLLHAARPPAAVSGNRAGPAAVAAGSPASGSGGGRGGGGGSRGDVPSPEAMAALLPLEGWAAVLEAHRELGTPLEGGPQAEAIARLVVWACSAPPTSQPHRPVPSLGSLAGLVTGLSTNTLQPLAPFTAAALSRAIARVFAPTPVGPAAALGAEAALRVPALPAPGEAGTSRRGMGGAAAEGGAGPGGEGGGASFRVRVGPADGPALVALFEGLCRLAASQGRQGGLEEEEEEEVGAKAETRAGPSDRDPFSSALWALLPPLRAWLDASSAAGLEEAMRPLSRAWRLLPPDPPPPSTSDPASQTTPPASPTAAAWAALEAATEPLLDAAGLGPGGGGGGGSTGGDGGHGGSSGGPAPSSGLVPPRVLLRWLLEVALAPRGCGSLRFRARLLQAVAAEVERSAFVMAGMGPHIPATPTPPPPPHAAAAGTPPPPAAGPSQSGAAAAAASNGGGRERDGALVPPPARGAATVGPSRPAPPSAAAPSPPHRAAPVAALSADEIAYAAAAAARLAGGEGGTGRLSAGVVGRLVAGVLVAAQGMRPAALVQAVWALAELQVPQLSPTGADVLLRVLAARLPALPAESLPLLLWSLAAIRLRPPSRWMAAATQRMLPYVGTDGRRGDGDVLMYDMRQVSQMVWSYGMIAPGPPYSKMYYRPPAALVQALLSRFRAAFAPTRRAERRARGSQPGEAPRHPGSSGRTGGGRSPDLLRPADAAAAVFGLAGLEARPGDAWLQGFYRWSGPRLKHFTARDLALTLAGLARLEARVPPGWLRRAAIAARRTLLSATGLDTAHVAYGLARLGPELVPGTLMAALEVLVPLRLRNPVQPGPDQAQAQALNGGTPGQQGRGRGSSGGPGAPRSAQRADRGDGVGTADEWDVEEGSRHMPQPDEEPEWAGFLKAAYGQLREAVGAARAARDGGLRGQARAGGRGLRVHGVGATPARLRLGLRRGSARGQEGGM
ncbi:hypothetical protein HYH03_005178 [Edaphochlamys debaryana]|uniref:Uncharacterized protein n=1 Tax=Edaphochlamys debaryana TaxID=47281 RepID=A0A835Y5Z0_9CHLO|nr:hypothetical protein HYH03_005178 [Edaphochlamys debaryana]|eukprot:KAG2496770.1 hypothetical protein HYH03_005178 [Edaphochlamys debaryana]